MKTKLYFLFLPLICITSVTSAALPISGKQATDPELQVSFHVDKAEYRLGDSMQLGILVKNISHGELYIFDNVGLDEANTLGLSIKNVATGKRYDVWLTSDPSPPPPSSKDSYKRLLPHELCGIEVDWKLSEFFINKAGQYELTALYESPITSNTELSYHLPMWGKEKGLIHSTPITISVIK